MFLVVDGQGSTCPRLNPRLLFVFKAHSIPCSHTHEISSCRHNNLPLSPMKDFRCERTEETS